MSGEADERQVEKVLKRAETELLPGETVVELFSQQRSWRVVAILWLLAALLLGALALAFQPDGRREWLQLLLIPAQPATILSLGHLSGERATWLLTSQRIIHAKGSGFWKEASAIPLGDVRVGFRRRFLGRFGPPEVQYHFPGDYFERTVTMRSIAEPARTSDIIRSAIELAPSRTGAAQ